MEEQFIEILSVNRNDDESRLVYADWLEDAGDPRNQFLRAELMFIDLSWFSSESTVGKQMINELVNCEFPTGWMDAIGLRFNLQFHGIDPYATTRLRTLIGSDVEYIDETPAPVNSGWRGLFRGQSKRTPTVVTAKCKLHVIDSFTVINRITNSRLFGKVNLDDIFLLRAAVE